MHRKNIPSICNPPQLSYDYNLAKQAEKVKTVDAASLHYSASGALVSHYDISSSPAD